MLRLLREDNFCHASIDTFVSRHSAQASALRHLDGDEDAYIKARETRVKDGESGYFVDNVDNVTNTNYPTYIPSSYYRNRATIQLLGK